MALPAVNHARAVRYVEWLQHGCQVYCSSVCSSVTASPTQLILQRKETLLLNLHQDSFLTELPLGDIPNFYLMLCPSSSTFFLSPVFASFRSRCHCVLLFARRLLSIILNSLTQISWSPHLFPVIEILQPDTWLCKNLHASFHLSSSSLWPLWTFYFRYLCCCHLVLIVFNRCHVILFI